VKEGKTMTDLELAQWLHKTWFMKSGGCEEDATDEWNEPNNKSDNEVWLLTARKLQKMMRTILLNDLEQVKKEESQDEFQEDDVFGFSNDGCGGAIKYIEHLLESHFCKEEREER
jgi:hypothetical protein